MRKRKSRLFDGWPDQYDSWFETPLGRVVKACEQDLVMEFLSPMAGEVILDTGCGTGVFTLDTLASGARVIGLDLSLPMLDRAFRKCGSLPFGPVVGDMILLPFRDNSFDKAVSVTALEFIGDAKGAVDELFRVTRSGGLVVVATLNSRSPWAEGRREKAEREETVFSTAIFRSPQEMLALSPLPGLVKTAVHFQRDRDPEKALWIEREGRRQGLQTGAFVAVRWQKP